MASPAAVAVGELVAIEYMQYIPDPDDAMVFGQLDKVEGICVVLKERDGVVWCTEPFFPRYAVNAYCADRYRRLTPGEAEFFKDGDTKRA